MRTLYCLAFSLIALCVQAQKFTIDGTVKDSQTGENIIGASIF